MEDNPGNMAEAIKQAKAALSSAGSKIEGEGVPIKMPLKGTQL